MIRLSRSSTAPKHPLQRISFIISIFLLTAPFLQAQLPSMSDVDRSTNAPAAGPLPAWDVAVVKPHPHDDPNMSWQMTADSVVLKNLTLEHLLCSAWDIKPYQLSGLTGWMESVPYDLTAKVSAEDQASYGKLAISQRREMLQKLLIERFQLKVHTETKTLPLYDLVVDKGGPKLKVTTALEAPSDEEMAAHPEKYKKGMVAMGPGRFEGTGVSVRSLASQLANALGKPVNDVTGLKGDYDIMLRYRRDEAAAGSDADAPSIFTAVQEQLGLKLVPSKGPVETLVVDAAQKPDEN